ncbi:MAG: hypothetical protein K2X67_02905 [Burkholderiales bacterium]|nr:hypothetical protein [Burkholderiales bacterium]
MNSIRAGAICLFAFISGALPLVAGAADSERGERWEATLQGRFTNSETLNFDNGASAKLGSSTGFGFGFAYNFDERLAAGVDLAWNNVNYSGSATPAGGGAAQAVSGTAYVSSLVINGTYHFFDRAFTPYVTGALGVTYTDTGIPAGVGTGCWWYPWYGYVCGPVTYTKTSTDWTYAIGAGLRWDVTRGFFLRAGAYQQWLSAGAASGTPSFVVGRFDIGFKF